MPSGGSCCSRHCAELTIREASARVSENQVESHHKRAMQILRDAGMAGMSKSDFTGAPSSWTTGNATGCCARWLRPG
jgi:hypothetical protein